MEEGGTHLYLLDYHGEQLGYLAETLRKTYPRTKVSCSYIYRAVLIKPVYQCESRRCLRCSNFITGRPRTEGRRPSRLLLRQCRYQPATDGFEGDGSEGRGHPGGRIQRGHADQRPGVSVTNWRQVRTPANGIQPVLSHQVFIFSDGQTLSREREDCPRRVDHPHGIRSVSRRLSHPS